MNRRVNLRHRTAHISKKRIFWRRFSTFLRISTLFAFIAIIVYSANYFFLVSDYFKISGVSVYGTSTFVNRSDIQKLAETHFLNNHVAKVDTKEISKLLMENFQGAKLIEIDRKLPDQIIVNVYERVPLALVTNKSTPNFYLVDEDGYVLGIVDQDKTNLPQITYDGELKVGYFIDRELVFVYLELLHAIERNNIKASTVSVGEKHITFYVNSEIEVLLGKAKDIAASVKIVDELVRQLALEGKEVRKIDLRYDKVVVEY
jgi:cell division septal protein FtsQ